MDNRSIGIFDSGLGGLTVLKEIKNMVPNEKLIYFGDSGRTPYGTKSKETVIKYTIQDIRFLLSHDIKMIVIACNTASACSLDIVKQRFDIPIIDVVGPGSLAAVNYTKNNKVGVIGTNATIASGVYETAINKSNKSIEVSSKACPLFVPLAEEGWWDNEITRLTASNYLEPLKNEGIDTLVLGCTHYPLLQGTISKVMGNKVVLVSSALEAAKAVKRSLEELNISCERNIDVSCEFYTSDSVEKFIQLGSSIIGKRIKRVEKIDIEKYQNN